jgi:hypothetical protein
MPSIYDLASNYGMTDEMGNPLTTQEAPPALAAVAPAPVAAPSASPAAAPFGLPTSDRNQALMSMLGRYFPQGDEYGPELKAARATMTKESEAFNKLLQDAIKQPQESGPGKAEMYFRLAAAFGAPTKTGNFMESLGKAGEAAASMSKEQREALMAERNRRLQLGLEAQKLRMTGAKEDVNTLRQLASEGMKDKRTIATELIKDYVKSGQPESSAGKQAKDEGLVPGTPEFQKRVGQIAEMNVEKQMAQINSTLAQMGTAQANMALSQQKFDFQQQQATKLTGPELKIKSETEDSINSLKGSMGILKRAFDLNKNSMGGSLVDKATRLGLEAAGSKDPVLVNTQELENLLTDQMISSAAEKMKGVLSDSDIKLLSMVSGAKSKNQEERKRIMINAYGALQRGFAKQQKRLNEINQGLYRETGITAGGLE